ncbi:MAG: hypothetical protein ACJA0Q_000294 [Saprospiraceae bacterium]|jgi:hypothetical protein
MYIKIFVVTNKVLFFYFFMMLSLSCSAQLSGIQEMDTVSVRVKGFTAEDFIKATKKDTSFYRAFKNLKIYNHVQLSKVLVLSKKSNEENKIEKASLQRETTHHNKNNKAWVTLNKESVNGKYYKRNGDFRFFTSEMFDKIFYPKDTVFASNLVSSSYAQKKPGDRSKKEKYYEQLKTFMFSPGTGVDGVPIIGDKLDIFSEEMRPYYDFTLEKVTYQDSIPCYLFICSKKGTIKERKVVIQYLKTYYDRRTMNIIARKYRIKDKTILFDFDIRMAVHLQKIGNEYFPSIIKYVGNWDVPFKKRERLAFQIKTKLIE